MARAFAAASSQYLENAAAVFTGPPYSLCGFIYPVSSATHSILTVNKKASGTEYHQVRMATDYSITHPSNGGGVGRNAVATGVGAVNTWTHGSGTLAAAADRRVYRDGGNKSTNTASITTTGIDTTNIGTRYSGGAAGLFADGRLAEVAAWDAALTDDDHAMLGKGFSPLLVKPGNLLAYWPLYGNASPEIDPVGKFDLTVTGATKAADHPRIFTPRRR